MLLGDTPNYAKICFILVKHMFSEFKDYIKEQANLSNDEMELMRSMAVEKTLRRKEFLLHEGEVCRYKIFITKGLLRTFSTRENGSEHIMRFSPENSWTTDPESFDNSSPSYLNIAALEPSDVVLWTKMDLRYLVTNIPGLKSYFDNLIYKSGNILRHRVLSAISLSAEEKYDEFVKNYSQIYSRVPLHMVASYLGVTRETLSRIRRAQAIRK
jgi:CRP-like cAMP-binding protein